MDTVKDNPIPTFLLSKSEPVLRTMARRYIERLRQSNSDSHKIRTLKHLREFTEDELGYNLPLYEAKRIVDQVTQPEFSLRRTTLELWLQLLEEGMSQTSPGDPSAIPFTRMEEVVSHLKNLLYID